MEVKVIKSGLLQTNTYIIVKANNCVIVDPAFAYEDIVNCIEEYNLNVLGILLTHGHFDHIDACNDLAQKYGCKVYIGMSDLDIVTSSQENGGLKYVKKDIYVMKKYLAVFDKEIIMKLDNFMIDVIFTPGHTKGSCCYLIDNELFSGDTLFKDGIGRVDLPTGSSFDMDQSLKRLFSLKNETIVFPGHGYETTILEERKRYIE